jgi:hypothetical protein
VRRKRNLGRGGWIAIGSAVSLAAVATGVVIYRRRRRPKTVVIIPGTTSVPQSTPTPPTPPWTEKYARQIHLLCSDPDGLVETDREILVHDMFLPVVVQQKILHGVPQGTDATNAFIDQVGQIVLDRICNAPVSDLSKTLARNFARRAWIRSMQS